VITGLTPRRRPGRSALRAHVRSRRQLGDLGDTYSVEQLSAAAAQVIASEGALWDAVQTYAQAYKLIAPALERAQKFAAVAATMRELAPGKLAEIRAIVAAITVVRNRAKVGYSNTPNAAYPDREDARGVTGAALHWLYSGVAANELANSNARVEFVRALYAAPGNALTDLLHLPSWALPVAVGVVGLVVLGHLTGAIRAFLPVNAR
jgi:hypothetical protein